MRPRISIRGSVRLSVGPSVVVVVAPGEGIKEGVLAAGARAAAKPAAAVRPAAKLAAAAREGDPAGRRRKSL